MKSQATWDHFSCSLSSTAFPHFLICCSTVISCPLPSPQTSPLSALPSSKCSSSSPPTLTVSLPLSGLVLSWTPKWWRDLHRARGPAWQWDSENRKLRRGLYFGLSVTPGVRQCCTAWRCCSCHCPAVRQRLDKGYQLLMWRRKLSAWPRDGAACDSGVRSNDPGGPFELLVSSLPLTHPQHPQICNLGLYHGKNKAFSLRSSASSYLVIKNKTKQQQQNSFAVGHSLLFSLMCRYFSDPSDKLDSNQLIIHLVL